MQFISLGSWSIRKLFRHGIILTTLICAGCTSEPPPPPLYLAGLPVSGSMYDAVREGFNTCFSDTAVSLRCQRHAIMLYGQGPYEASVDLRGSTGQSGFQSLTMWDDDDQRGLFKVLVELMRRGWHYCYTGSDRAGDQAIFTRDDVLVRVSMDISYYGKRRIRLLPKSSAQRLEGPCVPDNDLARFGIPWF